MRLEYFDIIDSVDVFDVKNGHVETSSRVPEKSTVFEGHFPGHPLMPGVLLLETMAQTSGWLVVAANNFERMAFLAAVKEAKFRTFVTPGQVMSVTAQLSHDGSGYAITEANISIDGKSVCDATLTLRILKFPNEEMKLKMHETAARVGFPGEAQANA